MTKDEAVKVLNKRLIACEILRKMGADDVEMRETITYTIELLKRIDTFTIADIISYHDDDNDRAQAVVNYLGGE